MDCILVPKDICLQPKYVVSNVLIEKSKKNVSTTIFNIVSFGKVIRIGKKSVKIGNFSNILFCNITINNGIIKPILKVSIIDVIII
jgi:hypothetical protein